MSSNLIPGGSKGESVFRFFSPNYPIRGTISWKLHCRNEGPEVVKIRGMKIRTVPFPFPNKDVDVAVTSPKSKSNRRQTS